MFLKEHFNECIHVLKSIIRPKERQTGICALRGFVSLRELFFILFHHGTRGAEKTESIFRTQAADYFFGEQSFSSNYVKRADIQLLRESEKQAAEMQVMAALNSFIFTIWTETCMLYPVLICSGCTQNVTKPCGGKHSSL